MQKASMQSGHDIGKWLDDCESICTIFQHFLEGRGKGMPAFVCNRICDSRYFVL